MGLTQSKGRTRKCRPNGAEVSIRTLSVSDPGTGVPVSAQAPLSPRQKWNLILSEISADHEVSKN